MRFLSILVLALAGVAWAEDKPKEWQLFSPEGGKFQVTVPGKPRELQQQITLPDGKATVYMFAVEPDPNSAYLSSYVDLSSDPLPADRLKQALDGCQDGNAKSLKGTVQSQKEITIGKAKHPGREIVIVVPEKKQVYRARVYMVGGRLYQVVALGSKEFAESKDTDKFLGSFKLIDSD